MPLKKGLGRKDIEGLLHHYASSDILLDFVFHNDERMHGHYILGEEDSRIQVAEGRLPELFLLQFAVQTGEIFHLTSRAGTEGVVFVLESANITCKKPVLAPNVLEVCLKPIHGIDDRLRFVAIVKDRAGAGDFIARVDFSLLAASQKRIAAKLAEHKLKQNGGW